MRSWLTAITWKTATASAMTLAWTFAATPALALSYDALGLDALPDNLQWEVGDPGQTFGSSDAKRGGTYRSYIQSYPLTLRTVGPDSNGATRPIVLDNQYSLTGLHPNSETIVPILASAWAYGDDGKTMYFKLRPEVEWSDGEPVTADDYVFAIEFMRSEFIVAPWYNNYYSEQITDVRKYDDHTISVTAGVKKPKIDLQLSVGISPRPQHFHKLNESWVTDNNWAIEPNTGPYQLTKESVRRGKGKYIELERKDDWWGDALPQFANRFNVDKVRYTVIRDPNIAYRTFEKGDLDTFGLVLPELWHQKAKGPLYDNGYIHRLKAYDDTRQPSYGMFMNQADALLSDRNIRLGIHHSMNLDKMIAQVLRGDYERLPQHYTGYGDYSDNSITYRQFDLALADQYFSQAGFTERGPDGIRVNDAGTRLSFEVSYGTPAHTDRLVVLKEEAKKAGLELELKLLDSQNAFKLLLEKRHQIGWSGWSTGFRPAYREHYHSDNAGKPQNNNITNMAVPEIDALIDQYRLEEDVEVKKSLSKQIQGLLFEQAAYIPTYMVPYTRLGYWRWMNLPDTNFATKTGGGLFSLFDSVAGGIFWLDTAEKRATRQALKDDKVFEPVTIIDETWKPTFGG